MQRLLAGSATTTAGEQTKAIVEPLDDLARRDVGDLRSGELDGQRKSVEMAADLLDLCGNRRQLEVGSHQ